MNPKIEHIGSTSILNLASKPIIDSVVGIENLNLLDETIESMVNQGYIYYKRFNSMMPFRRLFIGLKNQNSNKRFLPVYSEKDVIP